MACGPDCHAGHGGIGCPGHGGDRTARTTTDSVASIQPANGAVVGVAHPVIVTFTGPVTDRAAAERAIKITAPNHITGRFGWVDNQCRAVEAGRVLACPQPRRRSRCTPCQPVSTPVTRW